MKLKQLYGLSNMTEIALDAMCSRQMLKITKIAINYMNIPCSFSYVCP